MEEEKKEEIEIKDEKSKGKEFNKILLIISITSQINTIATINEEKQKKNILMILSSII